MKFILILIINIMCINNLLSADNYTNINNIENKILFKEYSTSLNKIDINYQLIEKYYIENQKKEIIKLEPNIFKNFFNNIFDMFSNKPYQKEENNELNKQTINLEIIDKYLNKIYKFGGNGINGYDCSLLTMEFYRNYGVFLPRTSEEQSKIGEKLDFENLKEHINLLKNGDLLFFETYKEGPSHVGIYIGNGNMLHASSSLKKINIQSLYTSNLKFLFANRILN